MINLNPNRKSWSFQFYHHRIGTSVNEWFFFGSAVVKFPTTPGGRYHDSRVRGRANKTIRIEAQCQVTPTRWGRQGNRKVVVFSLFRVGLQSVHQVQVDPLFIVRLTGTRVDFEYRIHLMSSPLLLTRLRVVKVLGVNISLSFCL